MTNEFILILIGIIAFLLGILFCAALAAMYQVLKCLMAASEKKALPLPRSKINLVEQLSYLTSMEYSERLDLQLFIKEAQARLDAMNKYDEEARGLLYILRNGPREQK